MLKIDFVVPRQFMFVPQTECKMLDLWPRLVALSQRPSLLYIMAQIYERNVSWIEKEAMHSFMIPKLIGSWGLLMRKAGKPTNV